MTSNKNKISENNTEYLFRNFYGQVFIEKTAIPNSLNFKSKNNPKYNGYPDFYKEEEYFDIVVEVKAEVSNHQNACEEIKYYIQNNKITKDIIGIAFSGQIKNNTKTTIFLHTKENRVPIQTIYENNTLITIENIKSIYFKFKNKEALSNENLLKILNTLNKKFHEKNKVKDTERSLFFSGLMIALKDNNFRGTFKNIQPPSVSEIPNNANYLESYNLNEAILSAIDSQLQNKINNYSKQYNWKDRFAFIKNIDFSLKDYIEIISLILEKIFYPFLNEEKQDILGKAYKIFLKRAGKIENKNIIITPDHIKELMILLARLCSEDVVLDTCTGTGGFLMEAMEKLIKLANNNETNINSIKEKQLIGFEIDSVLFALACSNMFLHGDGKTNLIYRSSLVNENSEFIVENKNNLLEYVKQFKPTKCIINPPYENNSSISFALQAIDYLENNGKLIIIMPTITLSKNQNNLTNELLKKAKLDFRIKMPFNLFSEQNRTVNTSIFGFTKTPHNNEDEVMFFNLEDDGLISIQHKGRVDKFKKWDYIKNNVLNSILNSNEIPEICEKKVLYINNQLNCNGYSKFINKSSNLETIDNLFNIEEGSIASDNRIDGIYDFITGAEDWKSHSNYKYDKEAIVYVTKAGGSLGRSHYVKGKFTASNLCLILTQKDSVKFPINLSFYNHFFNEIRKKIVNDLADGTSKLTIDRNDFKQYYIKYIDIGIQNNFVDDNLTLFNDKCRKFKEFVVNEKLNISNNLKKII
jgi:type I restriction enzyme M protein